MSVAGLKLTTYFGERDRCPDGRSLAEALVDLHARHRVRASCLLRGVEGFGAKHRLQTTRMLTLSEDLPLVSVAVDAEATIVGLLDEVAALHRSGLVTLERARLLDDGLRDAGLPGDDAGGDAVRLTLYLGRQQRAGGRPAHVAVVETLRAAGVDGATVLLGVDGTRDGRRQRARFFSRNADVPLMVISAGRPAPVAAALEQLAALLPDPLATVERVQVCKRDGVLIAPPSAAAEGHWQKLTVYASEQQQVDGQPLHAAIVRRLREQSAAGATAVRGVWGYHGEGAPHGDRLLALRRHVPVVTVAIDTPQRIASAFATIDELTAGGGLVTSEAVPAPPAGGATSSGASPSGAPPAGG